MPAAKQPRRGSGYHHGNLRAELERAALQLVAERGPHGFTMAEASRRAGVSVAAPFKHFSGREALFVALALRSYEVQAQRFAAAVAGSDDPVGQLAEFAAAYVHFAVEERPLFEITFGSGLDKRAHPELEDAGQRVLAVLTEPARVLRPDDESSLELVHAVAASAHGYAAFLNEGVFGGSIAGQLPVVADLARRAARTLAQAA